MSLWKSKRNLHCFPFVLMFCCLVTMQDSLLISLAFYSRKIALLFSSFNNLWLYVFSNFKELIAYRFFFVDFVQKFGLLSCNFSNLRLPFCFVVSLVYIIASFSMHCILLQFGCSCVALLFVWGSFICFFLFYFILVVLIKNPRFPSLWHGMINRGLSFDVVRVPREQYKPLA